MPVLESLTATVRCRVWVTRTERFPVQCFSAFLYLTVFVIKCWGAEERRKRPHHWESFAAVFQAGGGGPSCQVQADRWPASVTVWRKSFSCQDQPLDIELKLRGHCQQGPSDRAGLLLSRCPLSQVSGHPGAVTMGVPRPQPHGFQIPQTRMNLHLRECAGRV